MKNLILLAFFISTIVPAQEIYVLKEKDGSTLLTAREPTDEKYKDFTVEKKTYYPGWSPLGWNSSCSRDRFNGTKICSLSKVHSDVMVSIINGRYSVYVGENHYPNTQSVIKIDDNSPIYGVEGSSKTPQKVIEQMRNGKIAYTRYKEWPYEYNKDGEVDLTGFKEKFEQMKEEYKKL
ncbi:hypothetical protein E0H89_03485 [Acinetobacter sp. ANC 3781]|uniref:hypothetical protein n=1 Tax=Acinetobacter sp. ANC 3781 TaxID=2529835 RepID=UPI001038B8A8|nr:hypothetical protein [Acinetobacter sp. ANC 3781]TCB79329.1 hypothetical protein E0H89_03485 [Acinetobacter sp. ANC 3781]